MSKILIIEDDDLLLHALKIALGNEGFEVFTAQEGLIAMDMLKSQRFDLIITDMLMPFVSGLDIAKSVKSNELTKDTPVIILSTVGLEGTVQQALAMGVDDFLTKPFNLGDLVVRMRRLIKHTV